MIERHSHGKLTWVDAKNPTQDEIRELLETYALPPEFMGDLASPVLRKGVSCVEKMLKVTLDFPIVKRTDITHPHEVKFIVTPDTLITVRYEDMEAFHRFSKEFEVVSTLYTTKRTTGAAHLFFALLHELYGSLEAKLEYLESRMNNIEEEMYATDEKETVFAISEIGHRLIRFKHTLKAHDDILTALREHTLTCFTKTVAAEVDSVQSQYAFLTRRTQSLFEALEELRSTNFAILNIKQNEVMKILTIMAFVTFPLSLFTSTFGMNTANTPIVGMPGDFWIIMSIMSLITLTFFVFFRIKKWI